MANLQAELKHFFKAKALQTWLGIVKPYSKKNVARVRVPKYQMDENLMAYFSEPTEYFAYDPEEICKVGDTVLIKELMAKKTTLITHELIKVVYRLGDVIDPITNKKVMKTAWNPPKFRENIEELIKIYGESPNRFIYDQAPPRGWQEGKRDFTDKVITNRYYEDGTEDPYQVVNRRNFAKPEYVYPK